MTRAIQKQEFMVKIPYDDEDTINERGTKCTVTIEGTNLELIKYIQAIVFGTFKSYYYNGIPDEWKEIQKMSMGDVSISFKNKESF